MRCSGRLALNEPRCGLRSLLQCSLKRPFAFEAGGSAMARSAPSGQAATDSFQAVAAPHGSLTTPRQTERAFEAAIFAVAQRQLDPVLRKRPPCSICLSGPNDPS